MWLNLRAKLRPQFGADLKPRLVCRPSRSLSWWPKKWTSFAERALANRKCCARLGANEPKSACTPEACSEISRHPETRRCATCRSFPAFGLWRKRPGVLTGSAVGRLGQSSANPSFTRNESFRAGCALNCSSRHRRLSHPPEARTFRFIFICAVWPKRHRNRRGTMLTYHPLVESRSDFAKLAPGDDHESKSSRGCDRDDSSRVRLR